MSLSDERQNRFAHVIVDGIWNDDLVDYTDDDEALRTAKRAIIQYVKAELVIDEQIRTKIRSLKRQVVEGSPEWDLMFKKYYEEESNKKR
jgi:hypothetical protein